jgi:hypothetical protein
MIVLSYLCLTAIWFVVMFYLVYKCVYHHRNPTKSYGYTSYFTRDNYIASIVATNIATILLSLAAYQNPIVMLIIFGLVLTLGASIYGMFRLVMFVQLFTQVK